MEARKRLRLSGNADQTERALFANILQQRRLVKEAVNQAQQRRRKERIPPPVQIQSNDTGSDQVLVRAELQPYPVEIWERE